MTNSQDVFNFLSGVSMHQVAAPLPSADLSTLAQLNLVRVLTNDHHAIRQGHREHLSHAAGHRSRPDESEQTRSGCTRKTQADAFLSFPPRGKGEASGQVAGRRTGSDGASATTADLTARDQQFNRMVAEKSLLDTLRTVGNQYQSGSTGRATSRSVTSGSASTVFLTFLSPSSGRRRSRSTGT